MKIISDQVTGYLARMDDGKLNARLADPNIGFTWYEWSKEGWMFVEDYSDLETRFQKELSK